MGPGAGPAILGQSLDRAHVAIQRIAQALGLALLLHGVATHEQVIARKAQNKTATHAGGRFVLKPLAVTGFARILARNDVVARSASHP